MSPPTGGRPHFIGVGPEKTGTTWLFRNLSHHPDVWMVPVKETCFFYEAALYPGERWRDRLAFKPHWHHRRYWQYLQRRPGHFIKNPLHALELWRFRWDWRYIFDEHDDDWYLWSFKFAREGQISGEISPPYFFMPESGIAHMRRLVPHARIIAFIRNPVEWRWSFARMHLMTHKNRRIDQVSELDFEKKIARLSHYSFSGALQKWYSVFPPEQILVCYFDEISENPKSVLRRVCDFLGILSERMPKAAMDRLDKRVNKGRDGAPPPAIAERLRADSWEDIEALEAMDPTYPARWKARLVSAAPG